MADEIANTAPNSAAPIVEAAPSPTVVETAPVIETPVVETAPVIETAPVEAPAEPAPTDKPADAPVEPPKEESLLSPDEEAEKPVEGEKPADEKKAEESQSDEPAPLPTYEPFELPEGITFEEARLSEFTNMLGEFERTTNASHEEVQKLGQSLVDRHIAEVQTALERQRDSLVHEWNERKKEWIGKFEADPEIGGNRKETSLREAKEFIKTHGGNSEQINAFYNALKETGADSHPEIIRFILNVKNSSTFKTPQQLVAAKPVAEVKSKIAKRYGGNY